MRLWILLAVIASAIVVDAADPPPIPVPIRRVQAFYGERCVPCEVWKKRVKPSVKSDGWELDEYEPGEHAYKFAPYFIITVSGRLKHFKGYMPLSKLKEIEKELRAGSACGSDRPRRWRLFRRYHIICELTE